MVVEPLDTTTNQIVDENSIINDDINDDNINQEYSTQSLSLWNLISDWNIFTICLSIIVVASVLAGMYRRNVFLFFFLFLR